jgi:putative transposase
MGLLLKIKVHAANITDRERAKLLLSQLQKEHSNVKLVWTDMGYSGADFANWVQEETGWKVQTILRPRQWIRVQEGEEPPPRLPDPAGFTILPRHWFVEKCFAWMGKYRRLSKDYEGSLHHSESMAYLAMSRLMLNRISIKH